MALNLKVVKVTWNQGIGVQDLVFIKAFEKTKQQHAENLYFVVKKKKKMKGSKL